MVFDEIVEQNAFCPPHTFVNGSLRRNVEISINGYNLFRRSINVWVYTPQPTVVAIIPTKGELEGNSQVQLGIKWIEKDSRFLLPNKLNAMVSNHYVKCGIIFGETQKTINNVINYFGDNSVRKLNKQKI